MDSTRWAWLRSNAASELPSIVGTELQAAMPSTTNSAVERCVNVPSNFTCHLTLELSGGAAVRLNEMLDGCDEVRLGEAVGLDERRTMSNRPPQTTSSESRRLAATLH